MDLALPGHMPAYLWIIGGNARGWISVDATGDTETIAARVFAAAVSSPAGGAILCVVGDLADEHVAQRMAVRLLDGLCAALSTSARGML